MQIFLIGFMGSGKTTVGKRLAQRLNLPFIDTDHLIEQRSGLTIEQIFGQQGEEQFRKLEQEAIAGLGKGSAVIACGGGLPCFNGLIGELKQRGTVSYLEAEIPELIRNLDNEQLTRPLLKDLSPADMEKAIAERLRQRKPVFEQAHLRIAIGKKTIEEIVDTIVSQL